MCPNLRCQVSKTPRCKTSFTKLLQADWIAPNATVVGDVSLKEGSSLWHGATVRGDTAVIAIGKNSVLQDLVHISSLKRVKGDRVEIGDNVFVGPNATLDACTL